MTDSYTLAQIFPGYSPGEIMIDQLLYGSDYDHPAKAFLDDAPPQLSLAPLTWTHTQHGDLLDWIDVEASGPTATRMNLDDYDYYHDNYRITRRGNTVKIYVDDKVAAVGPKAMKLRYELAEHWTPIPRPFGLRKEDWGVRAERKRASFYSFIDHRAQVANAILDGVQIEPDIIDRLDLEDKSREELAEIIDEYYFYSFPQAGQWEYKPAHAHTMREAYAE